MPDVRVSQKDGTITIAHGVADESTTWSVTDHVTKVAEDKLDLFLARVEGSSLVSKPDTSNKDK